MGVWLEEGGGERAIAEAVSRSLGSWWDTPPFVVAAVTQELRELKQLDYRVCVAPASEAESPNPFLHAVTDRVIRRLRLPGEAALGKISSRPAAEWTLEHCAGIGSWFDSEHDPTSGSGFQLVVHDAARWLGSPLALWPTEHRLKVEEVARLEIDRLRSARFGGYPGGDLVSFIARATAVRLLPDAGEGHIRDWLGQTAREFLIHAVRLPPWISTSAQALLEKAVAEVSSDPPADLLSEPQRLVRALLDVLIRWGAYPEACWWRSAIWSRKDCEVVWRWAEDHAFPYLADQPRGALFGAAHCFSDDATREVLTALRTAQCEGYSPDRSRARGWPSAAGSPPHAMVLWLGGKRMAVARQISDDVLGAIRYQDVYEKSTGENAE